VAQALPGRETQLTKIGDGDRLASSYGVAMVNRGLAPKRHLTLRAPSLRKKLKRILENKKRKRKKSKTKIQKRKKPFLK
jgi:hypothetical protein